MMIYFPPLACIIGLLIYFSVGNPKWNHVGDVMFWCGFLVTCWEFAGNAFRLP